MPSKKEQLFIAGLIILYIISVIINLGYFELAGEEPRRAIISLEMLKSGNYFKPTQMGWDYYNKPVLFNWILCGFISLTNSSSEFTLRIPSLIFFLVWAYSHYSISKKFLPKNIALLSSLFMLTSAEIFFYGLANGAEIDIFYSFIVYLQAISIFYFFIKKDWSKLYVISYLCCAIGFLTKGFPSLVFQILTLVSICHYSNSIKVLWRPSHLLGIILFIVVISIYLFFYSQHNSPQRLLINFLNESVIKSGVGEFSNQLFDKAVRYPFLLFKLLAPWSLLLLFLNKRIWKEAIKNPFIRFSFLFIAYNIGVYWLTGQPKARYVYMFIPFAVTGLSFIYGEVIKTNKFVLNKSLKYLGIIFSLVLLAVLVLPFFAAVSPFAVVLLSIFLLVFLYFYFRVSVDKIWLFIVGIILCRLVYAALFIPVQNEKIANYSGDIKKAAGKLHLEPITFWAPPNQHLVAIESKIYFKKFETVALPPVLYAQVPYYYYKYTGQLVYYDTALIKGRNYLSFQSDIGNKAIDSIFSFENRKQPRRLIFYGLGEN